MQYLLAQHRLNTIIPAHEAIFYESGSESGVFMAFLDVRLGKD